MGIPAKSVIVIDDDYIIREIVKRIVVKHLSDSSKIFTSGNGLEGLGLISVQNPDLIILDTTLPKYAGMEVITYLEQNSSVNNNQTPVILVHEDEDFPKVNYSNVTILNKKDNDFLKNLESAAAKILNKDYVEKKTILSRFKSYLAKHTVKTGNASDILMHRIQNGNIAIKVVDFVLWFINQILLSIFLTLYYLFTGGRVRDENSVQRTKDTRTFRVRYYPTLTTILVAIFIGLIQLSAFVITGIAILNAQYQMLMAQQVCPLPSAPTVINSQIVVTPDNTDGIIDCSSLNIIVGSTGEVVFNNNITSNGSASGDWGVTLLVNNLTVQTGGKITADGKGYSVVQAEVATGKGGNSAGQTGGAGGGHGGAGGQGVEDGVNASGNGGTAYGTSENPSTLGSAGGSGAATTNAFSKTWNTDANFNEAGGTYSAGLVNPGTSNKISLKGGYTNDSLVGAWSMDESSWNGTTGELLDSSSYANNGTTFSGAAITNDSKIGNAGDFSASNSYATIPNATQLNNFSSGITVESWFKYTSDFGGAGTNPIIQLPASTHVAPYYVYSLYVDSINGEKYLGFWIGTDNGNQSCNSADNSLVVGNWYHVAGTYDGTNVKFYLNGSEVCSVAQTGALVSSTSDLYIAKYGNLSGSQYYTPGIIDQIRIYNKALNADEISTDYNSTGGFTSGDQTWTSATIDQSSQDGVKVTSLNATWSDDGSDNIHPKFQILGSNSGSFSGEEDVYPSVGTYYQQGAVNNINSGVALDLTSQISAYYKYIRVKTVINTGSNVTDTPTVSSIQISGITSQASSATGGAGGGSIKILATGQLSLDGRISANGLDGASSGNTSGGGGAGGSIWIEADSFAGAGVVEAKGGTAANVTFQGGGGGGGRIMMFCNSANSFTGSSSVSGGITELSQDGGVGTILGPTCRPNNPSILKQFKANQTVEIPVGGITPESTVTFLSQMSDVDSSDQLALQIEVKPLAAPFTGVPDYTQSPNSTNPQPCTAPPSGCGKIVVNNLSRSTEYHWRARVRDSKGGLSQWIDFGGNASNARDFVVAGIPTAISVDSGNNQSGTVYSVLAQPLIVKVTDASNIPVPGVQVNWSVSNSSNGGFITTSTLVSTDDNGFAQVSYQLGKAPGSNIIIASATGYGFANSSFTETGIVDVLSRFKIEAPSVSIVSEPFTSVKITAYDQFDNVKTDYAGTVNVSAVEALNINNAGSGNLSPATVIFDGSENGVKTINNFSYDTQQSIRIKAQDGAVENYSNVIAVVTSIGACPDVDGIIDTDETWTADTNNLGVFDCRGLVITVTSNATLTLVSYNNGDNDYSNDYETTIWSDGFVIDAGSKVTADAKGYSNDLGPAGGGGASYGGMGASGQNPYGSVYQPTDLGSGGTYDNFGGGGIKLVVTGLTDINGILSANGQANAGCHRSGGTGGSIWIDTNSINGTGLISANGGQGQCNGAGGAGGRIAIYYSTNNGMSFTDRSKLQAFGGTGDWNGGLALAAGAGTIYVEDKTNDTSKQGRLYVDNNNVATNYSGLVEDNYQFSEVNLTRAGNLRVYGNNSSISVNSGSDLTGDSTKPSLIVDGTFNGPQNLELNGVTLNIQGEINLGGNTATSNVDIGSTTNAGLTLNAYTWAHTLGSYIFDTITANTHGVFTMNSYNNGDQIYNNDFGVSLSVQNLNVNTGGNVNANANGYSSGVGPAAGGGASYGGFGVGGGNPYGSIYHPLDLGSGGNGTYGGGAIKLVIADTLNNNGTIEATGQTSGGCHTSGGTGGSIWIDTNSIRGSGLISSNGGNGICSGAGASGGRIAVYYAVNGDGSNNDVYNFESRTQIQSYGGAADWNGAIYYGGAGTIYVENKVEDSNLSGKLYVDNINNNAQRAGVPAGNYQFKEINLTRLGNVEFMGDGSIVTALTSDVLTGDNTKPLMNVDGTFFGPSTLTIEGLDVGIKGDILLENGNQNSTVNIGGALAGGLSLSAKTWARPTGQFDFGEVNIASNGIFTLNTFNNNDSVYTNETGVLLNINNLTIDANGQLSSAGKGYVGGVGPAYELGNIYNPTLMGGGWSNRSYGGGLVNLNVTDKLLNNGIITANGTSGVGCHETGGAGGSILITTNIIAGSGAITSNGGNGVCAGGGAQGGRIALYYTTNGESGNNLFGIGNSAKIQSFGGIGDWGGVGYGAGAGTIYVENLGVDTTHQGTLYIDNNSHDISTAFLPEDSYTLKQIVLTHSGNLRLLGGNSVLNILSGSGFAGDNSKPLFDVYGTINLPSTIAISGVNLGVRGKLNFDGGNENSNLTLGDANSAGMTLYAYHSNNLALNKTATMSSTYNGQYVAANCVNGDLGGTFCHSGLETNPWLKIDLGTAQDISRIRIWNRSDGLTWDRIKDYIIETSNSGDFNGEQNVVYSTTNNAPQRPTDDAFETVNTRYVRIVLIGTDYLSLQEVEVFGPDAQTLNQIGDITLGNIDIKANSALTLKSFETNDTIFTNDKGINLNLTNLNVEANGTVTADNAGYGSDNGPGAYVGFGNLYAPTELGRGGNQGASGGGAIALNVSGTATIDGSITANGLRIPSCHAYGGSGGSIFLNTNVLAGSGLIAANGAQGTCGGGGGVGGRIAIDYVTNGISGNNIFPLGNPNNVQAFGGTGDWNGGLAMAAGAGTIYVEDKSNDQPLHGILYVDNNNIDRAYSAIPEGTYNFKQIKLTRSGNLEVLGANTQLNVPNDDSLSGDNTKPLMNVYGTINMPSSITVTGLTVGVKGNLNFAGGSANSSITLGGATAGGLKLYANNGLNLARGKNVTQSSLYNGSYPASNCTDGNVGGNSCITNNESNAWTTVDLGANYDISAVRIWNETSTSTWDRIKDYKIEVSASNLFAGEQTLVYSTTDNAPKRPTTIPFDTINGRYIRITLLSPNYLSLAEIEVFGPNYADYPNLGNFLMGNVHVTSNGVLGLVSYNTADSLYDNDLQAKLTATNLTIDNGGNVNSDNNGYSAEQGPGGGGTSAYASTGVDYNRPTPYGSLYEPTDLGSGGTQTADGAGSLKLNITQTLQNDGVISASATQVAGCHQSGGTGGSVWIDADTLTGAGVIKANGGQGSCGGSGGGGGRIALYYNHNSIDLNDNTKVQAFGGFGDWNSGYLGLAGGAGTIYYEDKLVDTHLQGSLFIDNNNRATGGTSMNFEAKDYFFKNIYIGPAVRIKAVQDLYTTETEATVTTGVNTEVSPNMIGLWHFDETANGTCNGVDYCDATANGLNLTAHGSTVSSGKLGNALTLDGNSYAEIDVPSTINLGSMTISAWVKRAANTYTSGAGEEIINFNNIATTSSVDVYTNNGLRFEWPNSWSTGYQMPLDQWQLLTITYDSVSGKDTVYIDGVQVAQQTRGTGYTLPINTISIGKGGLDSGNYFEGQIDELAIYSGVISKEELAANAKTVALSEFNAHRGRGPVLNLVGNFYLGTGSLIDGYGLGFESASGRGAGQDGQGQSAGGGAGHGGAGGSGENDGGHASALGGTFYGSQRRPLTLGSGGGLGGTGDAGGAGGGAFAISARTGDVQILGTVDMRGKDGVAASPGGGGGAGGSILIEGQTCNIPGNLQANGGNGGDDSFDGGGGGGGRISVLYTAGPCDVNGIVTVAQGSSSGGQSGQIGTFPSISSIPSVPTFREQYKSDGATQIPVGGYTPEQTVKLKADLTDPGASSLDPKTLASEFEVVGINQNFTEANIITGKVVAQAKDTTFAGVVTGSQEVYTGGSALISEATISGLTPGSQYKWRARVVNVVDNIKGSWVEFGNNSSSQPDFTVSNTSSLDLSTTSTNVNIGDLITLTVTAKDQTNATDTTYTGTVHFTSNSVTATLPSNYVFSGADNGVKTFTDGLVFNQAGTYTVTVTDVLAPSLTKTITFVVAGEPVSIPVSGPISSPVGGTAVFCDTNPTAAVCRLVEISNVTEEITSNTSVKVCFNTNIPTVARVDYGLAKVNIYTNSVNDDDTNYSTQHCIDVVSLTPDSGYVYRIVATAENGNNKTYEATFATNKDIIVTVSEGVKQCIAFDEGSYAFNAQSQAILNYTTQANSMCTLYYGNDINNLEFKSESLEQVQVHQGVMELSKLDGVRDLNYRIECSVNGMVNMCTANGVIPVDKYLPYYPKKAETLSTNTIAPAALVVLTIATLLTSVFSYPSIATMGVPWLVSKKRKSTWGIVYDENTKEPIPFVTVRIFTEDGTVDKQMVTGFDGKYGFLVNSGGYELQITHSEYNPQKIHVQIEETEGIAAKDIGLVKRGDVDTNSIKDLISSRKDVVRKNLRKINLIIVSVGLLISIISIFINFNVTNAAVLLVYIAQISIVLFFGKTARDWGFVYDSSNYQRIKGASVRVFSEEEGRQVDVQIADEGGRFGFNLKDGSYLIQVNANGYRLSENVSTKYKTVKSPTGQLLIKTQIEKGKQINLSLPLDKGQTISDKFGM